MKTDVSIHFTLKGQTTKEIAKKLDAFCDGENLNNPKFDFSERLEGAPRNVLHHCFLPEKVVKEKGFPTDVYDDILDPFSEDKVCWYGTSDYGLVWDRRLMLENLKKVDGLAIFVGDIKEGVEEEYNIAKELGIECLFIP
jgi:hypothetical protein